MHWHRNLYPEITVPMNFFRHASPEQNKTFLLGHERVGLRFFYNQIKLQSIEISIIMQLQICQIRTLKIKFLILVRSNIRLLTNNRQFRGSKY